MSVVPDKELAPLSNLDEDLDDLDEKGIEQIRLEEDEFGKEGGTQHRLSPRLHDIEEEDDEDGRNTKERLVFPFTLSFESYSGFFGLFCPVLDRKCIQWFGMRGYIT